MKHLLSGVAIAAALVIAAPVWAQPANPSGGNGMGMPGPNPGGGGGLTPYSGGGYPTGGAPGAAPAANSAMPPVHHAHAVRHAHAMHAFHRHMAAKAALSGDTTAQLNREELARIQSGNLGNPPAPAAPMGGPGGPMPPGENPSAGNAVGTPGPNPGGPGLTPYSGGGVGAPPH